MVLTAVNPNKIKNFIPEGSGIIFKFKRLKRGAFIDMMPVFKEFSEKKDEEFKEDSELLKKYNEFLESFVKKTLVGWEDFKDEDGEILNFEDVKDNPGECMNFEMATMYFEHVLGESELSFDGKKKSKILKKPKR